MDLFDLDHNDIKNINMINRLIKMIDLIDLELREYSNVLIRTLGPGNNLQNIKINWSKMIDFLFSRRPILRISWSEEIDRSITFKIFQPYYIVRVVSSGIRKKCLRLKNWEEICAAEDFYIISLFSYTAHQF